MDTEPVLRVLTPLWSATPEAASRRRGRIEALLASAQVDGWIPEDRPNAAWWKNWLDRKLPKRKRLTRGHHKALDYRDIAEFVTRLRASDNMAALALEFLIVTRDQKRGNDQRAVAHTRPRRRRVVNSKGADEEDRRSLQRRVCLIGPSPSSRPATWPARSRGRAALCSSASSRSARSAIWPCRCYCGG